MKDTDLPIFDEAQKELGESISSLFASFLRERLANLTEQEKQVRNLIKQIKRDREGVAKEGVGGESKSDFDQAEAYARKVLEAIRNKDHVTARNLWSGAQSYQAIAQRSAESYRKLSKAIDRALNGAA
ncbi:MAG: hypothetical protein NTW28_28220 [Candidatus Solibacter sp.]|nr:hypothetical protein [Candidatus Solibacter sp.]